MKNTLILLLTISIFASCNNNNTDEKGLEQLDKKSAREVTLSTVKLGDSVMHITRQTIWYNGDKLVEKADTILTPNSSNTWSSNESTKPLTLAEVPIYVTVQ